MNCNLKRSTITAALAFGLVAGVHAQSEIDSAFALAWGENAGWINFSHDYGVRIVPPSSVPGWMMME